jgi:hypothetical protein
LLGHLYKYAVTSEMAVSVVDRLKVIQIEHEHCEG